MRATLVDAVELTATSGRAVVRLTPSWLARLLGARETQCPLESGGTRDSDGEIRWRFAATGRLVRSGDHGALILAALERIPVTSPPRAVATERLR